MSDWIHTINICIIVILGCYIYETQYIKTNDPVDITEKRCIVSKYKPTEFESAVKRTD